MRPIKSGSLYVVEFSDGVIKVGMGVNPENRIKSHAASGRVHGSSVSRSMTSKEVGNARKAEQMLIAFCKSACTDSLSKEWFKGVDFGAACEKMHEICNSLQGEDDANDSLTELAEAMIDSLFAESLQKIEDRLEWAASAAHGKVMQALIVNQCFSGEIFEKKEFGMSHFELMASIACADLPADEIADLYAMAHEDPEELIGVVYSAASAKVDIYRMLPGALP